MNNSDYPDLDILDTVSDLDAEKIFTPPKVANLVLDLGDVEIPNL